MIDFVSVLAIIVITYLLYDRLLRIVKVGSYVDKRLDALGFSVFAGCLTEDGRLHLSKNCSKRLVPILLDIRDSDSIQSALHLVKRSLPKDAGLWGLVNNAGVAGNMSNSEFCTKKDYLACFDVNLFGPIEMTRTFLPLIRKAKGRIVNTSSGLGRLAVFAPTYTVSKYGIEAFSDIVRREMYGKGVKVIIVEPGAFRTPIMNLEKLSLDVQNSFDEATEEVKSEFKNSVQLFRKRMTEIPFSPNIDLVVDAYIHGLASRFPRTRYAPGLDCLLFYIPMSYLPTFISDWWLQYQYEL